MTAHMKDLAKRFFMLLHVFLTRRYTRVELVFIRHTDKAQEVDEETFFRSVETGGTLVSSAFVEMARIVKDRYDPASWNIYAAQASDGDNQPSDNEQTRELLKEAILPLCQYFAYVEVADPNTDMSGPRSTRARAHCGWPTRRCEVRKRRSRCDASRAATISIRCSGSYSNAAASAPGRLRDERRLLLFEGNDWDSKRSNEFMKRSPGSRTRSSAWIFSQIRSKSSRPSKCWTPMRRPACRCSTGTGPSASGSRSTRASTGGLQGLAYEIVINSNPCISYIMEENTARCRLW